MTEAPKQAVVLCGGLGTRLKPLTNTRPKPMVLVNGKPFLEHLLTQIADQGIRRFLLLTGYLGEQIRDYFGDGGKWGWTIEYSQGPVEWDTGKRLWEAKSQIEDKFLLLYSDNFVQFSLSRLLALHAKSKTFLSLLLAPKSKGNMSVSADGRVEVYDKTRTAEHLDFVDVGYMMVERDEIFKIFPLLQNHPNTNFSEVLQRLVENDSVAGLVVRNPYHSISDPARLELMSLYLKPKKIILIDRDGVMNEKAPRGEYVSTWSEFKWIPETRLAMKQLAERGFQFIVITNQAGIARKMISPENLEQIHCNMVRELQEDDIKILKIYMCPHHWDEKCYCRKPSPGMFFEAAKDFNLRMDHTIFVGDDPRDSIAAYNAGCHSILVGKNNEDDESLKEKPMLNIETCLQAVPWICKKFKEWEGQDNNGSI